VKHQWNRGERQLARQDVPLAKHVQTEEEERQQKEAMQRLEESKRRLVVASALLSRSA